MGIRTGPIIFANSDLSVIVLDVPRSIEAAQNHECGQLLSVRPVEQPWTLPEPKSRSSKHCVNNFASGAERHEEYIRLCDEALEEINLNRASPKIMCYARWFEIESLNDKKRKQGSKLELENEMTALLRSSANSRDILTNSNVLDSMPDFRNNGMNAISTIKKQIEAFDGAFINLDDSPRKLNLRRSITSSGNNVEFTFVVPPNSAVVLSPCESKAQFRKTAKTFTAEGRFDFILLDPPWPNKSANRKKSYDTELSMRAMRDLLLDMDLDTHLRLLGFVAIWTTNSALCREVVLGEGAVFDAWNLQLVEEWIWLKITSNGTPVTPLDSLWRKPYEIVLVGRRMPSQGTERRTAVRRRVLIAVPDVHTRKPCLKQVVERTLLHRDYTGLEVFARNLTSGWLSWGNEVLKHNWEQYWKYDASS